MANACVHEADEKETHGSNVEDGPVVLLLLLHGMCHRCQCMITRNNGSSIEKLPICDFGGHLRMPPPFLIINSYLLFMLHGLFYVLLFTAHLDISFVSFSRFLLTGTVYTFITMQMIYRSISQ